MIDSFSNMARNLHTSTSAFMDSAIHSNPRGNMPNGSNITITSDFLEVSIKIRDPDREKISLGETGLPNLSQDKLPLAADNRFGLPGGLGTSMRLQESKNLKLLQSQSFQYLVEPTTEHLNLYKSPVQDKGIIVQNVHPIKPEDLIKKILKCDQCPQKQFQDFEESFGHHQNIHGLKFCPVCFVLVNCHDSFLKQHLDANHVVNDNGDVACPICSTTIHHVLCFDHIQKEHMKGFFVKKEVKLHNMFDFRSMCMNQYPFPETTLLRPETPGEEELYENDINLKVQPIQANTGLDFINQRMPPKKRKSAQNKIQGITKKPKRIYLDEKQTRILDDFFQNNKFPTAIEKLELTNKCNVPYDKIGIWFTNRRKLRIDWDRLTVNQQEKLLAAFKKNANPSHLEIRILAQELGLNITQVSTWFKSKQTKQDENSNSEIITNFDLTPLVPHSSNGSGIQPKPLTINERFAKVQDWINNCETVIEPDKALPDDDDDDNNYSMPVLQREVPISVLLDPSVASSKKLKLFESNQSLSIYDKKQLANYFMTKQYLTHEEYKALATEMGSSRDRIKNWFHRQRILLKKFLVKSKDLDSKKKETFLNQTRNSQNLDLKKIHFYPKLVTLRGFTNDQVAQLIKHFNENLRPEPAKIYEISKEVKLSQLKVSQWFRNRYQRLRRGNLPGYDQNLTLIKHQETLATLKFIFSEEQEDILIKKFKEKIHPEPFEITEISTKIGKSEIQVSQWFSNRFQRLRRGKLPGYDLKGGVIIKLEQPYTEIRTEKLVPEISTNVESSLKLKPLIILVKKLPANPELWPYYKPNLNLWNTPLRASKCPDKRPIQQEKSTTLKRRKTIPETSKIEKSLVKNILSRGSVQNPETNSKILVPMKLTNDPALNKLKPVIKHRKSSTSRFSEEQRKTLQVTFKTIKKPSLDEVVKLSETTNLTQFQIYSWFSAQRHLQRQKGDNKLINKCITSRRSSPKRLYPSTRSNKANLVGGNYKKFTEIQRKILQQSFTVCPTPDNLEIAQMAAKTGLTEVQIIQWFNRINLENRRKDLLKPSMDLSQSLPGRILRGSNTQIKKEHLCKVEEETSSALPDNIKDSIKEEMIDCTNIIKLENITPIAGPSRNTTLKTDQVKSELITIKDFNRIEESLLIKLVERFSLIQSIEISEFENKIGNLHLNFKNFIELFVISDEDSKEWIEKETGRLKRAIDLYEPFITFTFEQEELLMEKRIEVLNELLREKPSETDWCDAVNKFHMDNVFRTWYFIATYANLSEITIRDAIEEFCSKLHDFDAPSWLIPQVLMADA